MAHRKMRNVPNFLRGVVMSGLVGVAVPAIVAASELQLNDIRLVYRSGTNVDQKRGVYATATNLLTWGSPQTIVGGGTGTISWVQSVMSPRGSDALIGVGSDLSSSLAVEVYRFGYDQATGTWKWFTSDGPNRPSVSKACTEPNRRAFDIAYEQRSGDALVAIVDATTAELSKNVRYWTYSKESGWAQGSAGVFTTDRSRAIKWVRLVSVPSSDEVMLLAQTAISELYSARWDGTAWTTVDGPESYLIDDQVNNGNSRDWDLICGTYPTTDTAGVPVDAGRCLVTYRDSGVESPTSSGIHSRTWSTANAAQWSAEAVTSTFQSGLDYVRCAAEPGGRQAACVAWNSGVQSIRHYYGAIWQWNAAAETGSWIQDREGVDDGTIDVEAADGRHHGGVGWLGAQLGTAPDGVAILAYADDPSGGFDWFRSLNGGSWGSQTDQTFAPVGVPKKNFQIEPFVNNRRLIALVEDSSSSLSAGIYDGSSWQPNPPGTPSLGGYEEVPFSFAVNRFVEPKLLLGGSQVLVAEAAAATTRPAPALAITDSGGVIRQNDYVRIILPGSVSVEWDPTDTTVTVSPDVTPGLSDPYPMGTIDPPTQNKFLAYDGYETAFGLYKILRLKALRNFRAGQSVTLSNLTLKKIMAANPLNPASDVLTLSVSLPGDYDPATPGDQNRLIATSTSTPDTLQVVEKLELRDPAAQASNAFLAGTGTVTQAPLLRFRLAAIGGEVLPTQFKVFFSPSGATPPTPSTWKLYRDTNGNGAIDVGEPSLPGTVAGSQVTFTETGSTDTASTLKKVTTTAAVSYLVAANVGSLDPGDQLTLRIASADLQANGLTSGFVGLHTVSAITQTPGSKEKTHVFPERLTLANVSVPNAFAQSGGFTGKDVLQFTATASGGSVTLTRVNFSKTFANGMSWSNLTQLELWESGSPSAIVTHACGAGCGDADLDFSGLARTIAVGSPKTYTLKANGNVAAGHEMTVSLAPSAPGPTGNVEAGGTIAGPTVLQSVPNAITVSGSPISKTHTLSAYVVTAPVSGASLTVGASWTISWQYFGSASHTNVAVEYRSHAQGWQDLSGSCTFTDNAPAPGQASCVTRVPDAASTQAQVRITDNTDATITTASPPQFNITIALSGLTPNGGGTWVVGKPQQVQWTQTGSTATTDVELSLDSGGSYTVPIAAQPVTVSAPSYTLTSTAAFTPQPSHVVAPAGTQAKVRVSDRDGTGGSPTHPAAALASAGTFTIDFAYKNIQFNPLATSVAVGSSVTIEWTNLAGYASRPVVITALGGNPGGLPPGQIANSGTALGSYGWIPTTPAANVQLQICDAVETTVCATSAPFDVVALSVTTHKSDPAVTVTDFTVEDTMLIRWQGANAISQVRLFFKATDGSPDEPIGTAAGPSGNAGFNWPIPDTLGVKKVGRIRLEDAGNPAIAAESSLPVTIHGVLGPVTSPADGSSWLIGSSLPITWNGKGSMRVKLEYSTNGGSSFSDVPGGVDVGSSLGSNTFTWTPIPAAAKSAAAVIRITDRTDPSVAVMSSLVTPFHIIGQLAVTQPAGGNFSIDAGTPIPISWTTGPAGVVISPVRLRVLNSAGGVVFEDPAVSSPGSPTTYNGWTPTTTGKNLTVQVCDTADVTVCGTSAMFNVSGISVATDQSVYTLTSGGVAVTVQWRPVGIGGNFRAYYQVGGVLKGQIPDSSTTYTSNEDVTNTFAWTIPATFADLSDQVQAVVKDVGETIQGVSPAFSVRGDLQSLTVSPLQSEYAVTDPLAISWTTIGQITVVDLWWSTDNCVAAPTAQTRIAVPPNTPNGVTSVTNWPIPLAAVSNNLRFCLKDLTPGNAALEMSAPIVVGAKLTFQGLTNGDNWAVGTPHDITWTTVGAVGQVLIEYGQESAPGVFTSLGAVNGGPLADSGTGTTTVSWTVADAPAQFCALPPGCDPQTQWQVPIKLQIKDATAGHPAVPAVSAETLNAHYYHIEWIIKDENGTTISDGVSVVDSSGWTAQDDAWVPSFDPFDGQLRRYRFYKAGTYTTQVSKANYQPGELRDWAADGHKTLTIIMISDVGATIPIRVNTAHHYDPATQQVTINAWLEERGQLQSNPAVLGPGPATIEIYNGATPLLVSPLSDASADSAGQYVFAWDATGVAPGIYFARAKIERVGNPITSGGAFNIEVVGSGGGGGVTLTELQTELAPIATAVTTTLPGQINTVGAAIQGDIATVSGKVDAVQADTGALKLDTAAILGDAAILKADTAAIRSDTSQLITKVDNVQAYLADPNAGLPKILSNQDAMQTQLKAQRRGGILNRDMELEQGERATIRYRSVDDALPPSITIFTPLGGTLGGPMLQVSSNLYEYSVDATDLGEYRVVVTEPVSDNSAGTLDSITLTSVTPRATAQGTSDLATQLTSLSAQLSTVEANLSGQLGAIQSAMATQVQVDTAIAKVDQLLAKWGALSAQDLQDALAALSTQLGTPAQDADMQAALGQLATIQTDMAKEASLQDALMSLAGLQTAVANLSTQMGTPAQEGSMQNALNLLAAVQGDIANLAAQTGTPAQAADLTDALNQLLAAIQGIPSAIDYSARFDQIDGTLTALSTQMGDPAQRAVLDSAITKLDAIELSMAKETSVQSALTNLGMLQANLDTLSTQVGTPAQAAELTNAVTQIIAEIQAIPGAADYTPQLTALQASMDTMNTAMGTPSQTAAVQAVADQVMAVQDAIASLPPAVDYSAQLGSLQSDLTTLMTTVQDPAQAAAVQAVTDQISEIHSSITSLPAATNYSAQLQAIDTAVAELKTQVAALPTTVGSEGSTETVLEQLEVLRESIESAQGSSAAVGLSQSAFNAASEAVKMLQQLQAEVRANGIGAGGPPLLAQVGERLKNVSQSITVIPGTLGADELSEQLKALAKQANGVATEKGYQFDSLYEMSESQVSDVKTVRNQVEELKALLDVQRNILERNLDQPMVKTWFEAR